MPKLPRDVSEYLDKALKSVDWQAVNSACPDLCKDCPQSGRAVNEDDPVCLSCP